MLLRMQIKIVGGFFSFFFFFFFFLSLVRSVGGLMPRDAAEVINATS